MGKTGFSVLEPEPFGFGSVCPSGSDPGVKPDPTVPKIRISVSGLAGKYGKQKKNRKNVKRHVTPHFKGNSKQVFVVTTTSKAFCMLLSMISILYWIKGSRSEQKGGRRPPFCESLKKILEFCPRWSVISTGSLIFWANRDLRVGNLSIYIVLM